MDGIWSTVILCVVLLLICVFAVWSYVKKLKNGCCGADGDAAKRIRPFDKDLSHYPYERKIKIEGMHCKNCALQIENAFHKQEGYYATVSLKKNEAVVKMKEQVSDDVLKKTVRQAGYSVVSIETANGSN